MCREAEWLPIGLPYAGKTFEDETPARFFATLVMLREVGYHFPGYVIDAAAGEMKEEIKDGKNF